MANPSVKITSNFSFSKLANNIDKILKDSNLSVAEGLAAKTRKNIEGGLQPQLSPATIEARQKGQSSFSGHNPSSTTETRPLIYTGRLLKSIKATEKGVEGESYGLEHETGFPGKKEFLGEKRDTPPRPFLAKEIDKKEAVSIIKEMYKEEMKVYLKDSEIRNIKIHMQDLNRNS